MYTHARIEGNKMSRDNIVQNIFSLYIYTVIAVNELHAQYK